MEFGVVLCPCVKHNVVAGAGERTLGRPAARPCLAPSTRTPSSARRKRVVEMGARGIRPTRLATIDVVERLLGHRRREGEDAPRRLPCRREELPRQWSRPRRQGSLPNAPEVRPWPRRPPSRSRPDLDDRDTHRSDKASVCVGATARRKGRVGRDGPDSGRDRNKRPRRPSRERRAAGRGRGHDASSSPAGREPSRKRPPDWTKDLAKRSPDGVC